MRHGVPTGEQQVTARTMIANAIRHDVPHCQHLDAGLTHYAPELSMRCLGSLQVYWPFIQRGSERKQCGFCQQQALGG